jgi:hypothetical protein
MQVEQDASNIRLYWPLVDASNIILCELTLAAMVQLETMKFHDIFKNLCKAATSRSHVSQYTKIGRCNTQDASNIRLYWPLVDASNIILCELTLAAMVQLAKPNTNEC